jgi:NAD(P)H-dependent flavin oxidoreductase YrpB (nitropropane dioxygenase family)
MDEIDTHGPSPRTRLTEAFGIRYPIAAAGMAFVGMTSDLAIAVCRAGGIGALGVGKLPPSAMAAMIGQIRAATEAPFNVNFITIFTEPAHIDMCIELHVPIVSFHWGHPDRRTIDRLRAAGIKVWEQVGGIEAGKRAVGDGIDAIIAQGTEAGGHNYGTLPGLALIPEMVDKVRPPMLMASGGIADGRGLAAALSLGADGVWIGSRLVASTEAYAHPDYKKRLVEAAGTDTTLSSAFGPEERSFNPMRVLRNAVTRRWEGHETDIPVALADRPIIGQTNILGQPFDLPEFTNFVPMPTTDGDLDRMPMLAGEGVGLIDAIEPVATILTRMAEDAARILGRLAQGCRHA